MRRTTLACLGTRRLLYDEGDCRQGNTLETSVSRPPALRKISLPPHRFSSSLRQKGPNPGQIWTPRPALDQFRAWVAYLGAPCEGSTSGCIMHVLTQAKPRRTAQSTFRSPIHHDPRTPLLRTEILYHQNGQTPASHAHTITRGQPGGVIRNFDGRPGPRRRCLHIGLFGSSLS